MRITKLTRGRALSLGLAVSMVAVGTVGFAGSSQAAATYTVSPKSGPGGTNAGGQPASGAKVITINGSGFRSAAGTLKVANVRWVATGTACTVGATALATYNVPDATKIVATIPANTLALTATTTGGVTTYSKKDYTLCVYDATPTLLGSAKYTVYPVPTISAAVSPASGGVSGGGTVAVEGTGFTSTAVVKFGTLVATGVKVATDGKSLTAKVPAGVAGAVAVSVTTEGGTNPTPATAAWDDYTYVNAIAVSPALGDGTAGNPIVVKGVGFTAALDAANANAGVVWTRAGMTAATDDLAKCTGVQIISDTELTCNAPVLTDGAYIVVVTSDDTSAAAAYETVVSGSAAYTAADF